MPSWNGHFRSATDPKFGVRISCTAVYTGRFSGIFVKTVHKKLSCRGPRRGSFRDALLEWGSRSGLPMPTSTCAPAPRVESIKHSKCLMLGVRTLPSLQLIGHEVARTESQRLLLSAQSQGVSPQEQSRGGRRGSAARRRSPSQPRSRRAGLRGPGAATGTRAAPGRVRRESGAERDCPCCGAACTACTDTPPKTSWTSTTGCPAQTSAARSSGASRSPRAMGGPSSRGTLGVSPQLVRVGPDDPQCTSAPRLRLRCAPQACPGAWNPGYAWNRRDALGDHVPSQNCRMHRGHEWKV